MIDKAQGKLTYKKESQGSLYFKQEEVVFFFFFFKWTSALLHKKDNKMNVKLAYKKSFAFLAS